MLRWQTKAERRADGAGEARARFAWSLAAGFGEGPVRGAASEGGEELSTQRAAELGGARLSHQVLRIGETLGLAEDDSD